MNALRWFLLIVTALGLAGFLGLVVLGEGFRRSFGASGNGALKITVPALVMLLLLLSLLLPGHRWIGNCAAIAALVVACGSVWVMRESSFVGLTGILYVAAWFAFYWMSAHARSGSPTP
ncbi:MAG: hypothetical protein JNK85_29465 [Verrucomicrobiales bacterium]|nr:hypothetical protein [Verrucomicrobiales bacterium]